MCRTAQRRAWPVRHPDSCQEASSATGRGKGKPLHAALVPVVCSSSQLATQLPPFYGTAGCPPLLDQTRIARSHPYSGRQRFFQDRTGHRICHPLLAATFFCFSSRAGPGRTSYYFLGHVKAQVAIRGKLCSDRPPSTSWSTTVPYRCAAQPISRL